MTEYKEAGWSSDLPDLQQGRWDHGCSYYNNDEGTKVNNDFNSLTNKKISQTYLVTGGMDQNGEGLSSTELLVEAASAWALTGELPSPRHGLHGANIDNRVLMTGN